MQLRTLTAAILLASSATLITACGGGSSNTSTPEVFNLENAQRVINTNADIALAAYTDSVITAEALQTALATFKTTPTEANFTAAKTAWLVSREPYGQTEVYRFRDSPIDDADGPEGDINAWPLGEALIDNVVTGTDFGPDQVDVISHETGVDFPTNNIINSTAIVINEALISNTATADDEHDVIAGYHAIEFLLWGQDLNNDGSADTELTRDATAGNRPLTDFTTADNADRRHTYLEVAAAKLVSDLKGVRDEWEVGAAYHTSFTTVTDEATAKEKLTEILTGMGTLSEGELAGERMQIAYSSNSQEDEHSCFSDNTHRDVWLNAEGVSNSFYGDYAGYSSDLSTADNEVTNAVSGYGMDDYLMDAGLTELKAEVEALFTDTETNYTAIDALARTGGMPFDVQIQPENRANDKPIAMTIISLNAQSTAIQKIATELGLGDVVDDDGSECDTTMPGNTCGE